MSNRGRPTKYSEEMAKNICTLIQAGASYEDAAVHAGICYVTFNEWRKHFPDFSVAVEEAETACKMRAIALLQAEMKNDVKWAAWWLSRRYSNEYGEKKEHTHRFAAGAENTRKLLDVLLAGTNEVRGQRKKNTRKVSKRNKRN